MIALRLARSLEPSMKPNVQDKQRVSWTHAPGSTQNQTWLPRESKPASTSAGAMLHGCKLTQVVPWQLSRGQRSCKCLDESNEHTQTLAFSGTLRNPAKYQASLCLHGRKLFDRLALHGDGVDGLHFLFQRGVHSTLPVQQTEALKFVRDHEHINFGSASVR